jgi:hypothetical protein
MVIVMLTIHWRAQDDAYTRWSRCFWSAQNPALRSKGGRMVRLKRSQPGQIHQDAGISSLGCYKECISSSSSSSSWHSLGKDTKELFSARCMMRIPACLGALCRKLCRHACAFMRIFKSCVPVEFLIHVHLINTTNLTSHSMT